MCPDCGKPSRPDLVVFSQPDGTPTDPRRDWSDWSALLAAAGLPHYRVHDSRHGLATTLLEAGMDVKVVQEVMRHSSPNTTRLIYQHVRPRLRSAATSVIEQALTRRDAGPRL